MFREEAGRLTASLVRLLGDFDLAEEMVSEALAEALVAWPARGVPERPAAWLLTTARRKAIDRLRRDRSYRKKLALVAALPDSAAREPDDRLRLVFTCCHPAIDPAARVALTLRAVAGLTTAEIARAFVVPEATVAKRMTRAKQKIVAARVPYETPGPDELAPRLASVLRVVYLVFNEGFFTTSGDLAVRRELADDAEWLAAQLAGWLPEEPEPLGLLALVRLHLARWQSRIGPGGDLVVLADQDRTRWDRTRIEGAVVLLERAAALGPPGPYMVEAAIAAVHCEAPAWERTDWSQLLALYSMLEALDPSPMVRLSQAVVLGQVEGPAVGLAAVEQLEPALARYHLFHAVRASLLREVGRPDDARAADGEALRRTANPAERALLVSRLS